MDNGFWFAGRHTSEFALSVEKYPAVKSPKRRRTRITVPGRNGALHLDEGVFDNMDQPYLCYFHSDLSTPEQAHKIAAWLLSAPAGVKLEDVYDPAYYRMATYSGPLDVENILNRYGRCTITFDCAPQRYLKSGDMMRSFSAPGALYNPTLFASRPIITVTGADAGTVSIGGCTVEIRSLSGSITLDCELMDAFRQVGDVTENANSQIYAPEFPELAPGRNTISWDGGITSVDIVPRWWTL